MLQTEAVKRICIKGLQFALQKLAGEGKRRKAIVVLTDGVDTAMQETRTVSKLEVVRRISSPDSAQARDE